MSKLMQWSWVLLLCLPLAALPAVAQPGKHKPPRATLDEDNTPLQKIVRDAREKINHKIQREKENGNTRCAEEENSNNDDGKKKHRISKACDVAQFLEENDQTKESWNLEDAHKKRVGRRVKTRTKLVFDHPRQRAELGAAGKDASRWEEFKYTGRPNLEMVGLPGAQAANIRVRTAVLPTSEGVNNDKDCIDTATGERLGGWIRNGQGGHDENPNSCFDAVTGKLKKTLTLVEGGDGGCVHANGKVYPKEECERLELTTLEELIDEDGAEGQGQPQVDQDQDGFENEDGPEVGTSQSPCVLHEGVPVPGSVEESCDLTQAARKKLNQKALEAQNDLPPGQQKHKPFKLNANGECDDTAEGDYPCGEEPREIELEETMELVCPPGGEYEDGRCKVPVNATLLAAEALPLGAGFAFASSPTLTDEAMMGFTFAPPVLKWGVNEVHRVCIFGFCFEIFALRFGYEFELAAGLRLPVTVTVNDIPSPQVEVEQERTLTASLEPANFTVSQYKNFCQKHHLDRAWWISDCDRFAFPEYFESLMPDWMFSPAGERQGSEFVLQNTTFAGLVIRLFSIPVVNYAVDASVNVPAMCSLYKMKQQIAEGGVADWMGLMASFGQNMAESKTFMRSLEGTLANCASFTTPWGEEGGKARQFPFLTGEFSIPADCTREIIEGKALNVGGQKRPMCTGLKVTIYGATLGLGLQLVPEATSDLIKAWASTAGDARELGQSVSFHWGHPNPTIGPIRFDNYPNGAGDTAVIKLDDFAYYLNRFSVQANGLIELGGLLAFIGNVATIPLVKLTFDAGEYGIPIPQHPDTGPITIEVPVANYALSVDAKPKPDDPQRVNDEVLRVKPGVGGVFDMWVKNEGSVPDTMDNFTFTLSNRPYQGGAYVFEINTNTDFDCRDGAGQRYRGYPYDGVADDCYDAAGAVLAGRSEDKDEDPPGPAGCTDVASCDNDGDGLADEDPPDVWTAWFGATSVANVAAHSVADTPVALTVVPFRHPLTKPGDYPVRVTADSRTARTLDLDSPDPSLLPRLGAPDVVLVRIESFFDPQVSVLPAEAAVKPRSSVTYTVEALNGGNDLDQIAVQAAFADSDTAGCSLTNNGRGPDCPYRAHITRIDPAGWTNVAELDALFPTSGLFPPLGNARDSFTIQAPEQWAGMHDTVYEFTLTAASSMDPAIPKAKSQKTARFKVVATKESMVRYLNLEVAEFLEQITLADAQGISAKGIQPVMLHPITLMTTKALEQILAGDLGGASKTLSSGLKVMEAVDRMVNGATLPEALAGDWKARSAAILADMAAAQASTVASQ